MLVEAFLGASRRERVIPRKRAGESSVYRTVCWMFLCRARVSYGSLQFSCT